MKNLCAYILIFAGCQVSACVICNKAPFPTNRDGYLVYACRDKNHDHIIGIYNRDFTIDHHSYSPTIKTYTIRKPGRYIIREALLFQGSDRLGLVAINIATSNVTLDFNQFSLQLSSGQLNRGGIIIQPDCNNIIIKGPGALTNFTLYGIRAYGTSSQKIGFLTINNLFIASQNIGVDFSQNFSTTISTNQIFAGATSVSFKNCTNTFVENNMIENKFVTGVSLGYTCNFSSIAGVKITNNKINHAVNNNTSALIFLSNASQAAIVDNQLTRTSTGNIVTGVIFEKSSKVMFENNTFAYLDIAIQDNSVSVGTPTTAAIINNKFLYNANKFKNDLYNADNALFIEQQGTPNNLSALTQIKPYQNMEIKHDAA